MTSSRCHHVALKVRDIHSVSSFYANTLGLREVARHLHDDGRLRSVWFDLDNLILMIETGEPTASNHQSSIQLGWCVVALAIKKEERAAWKNRLQTANVTIISESQYSLYFTDPEGNKLALSHYPDC